MPAEEMEDTEVAFAGKSARVGNSGTARGMIHEVVDPTTGDIKVISGKQVEHEEVREGGAPPRRFKPSTEALLDKLAQGNTEESDPDDQGLIDNDGTEASTEENDPDDQGLIEGTEAPAEGEGTDEAPKDEEVVNEWQQEAERYKAANERLVDELAAARKTPPAQRSDYEQTLVDAYKSYVDEGTVPALRKFIGAVIGAAPDSKEVAAELSGMYIDLTAQEVGVPLDQAQSATREAQRARLALARDKRERTESEKKTAPAGNSADSEQLIADGAKHLDSIINVKDQSGKSLAETYPRLVAMSKDLDGFTPGELIARAIVRDFKTGALKPDVSHADAVKHVATKIEAYYKGLQDKFPKPATKQNPTDTTKGNAGAKPASKDQRQGTGARTISNAKASVAPATPPKTKQQKPKEEAKRPVFKTNKERQDYALRHIK